MHAQSHFDIVGQRHGEATASQMMNETMAPMQRQSQSYVRQFSPRDIMLDGLPIIERDGGRIFDESKNGERDGSDGDGNGNGGSENDRHDKKSDDDDSPHQPQPMMVSTTTRWLMQPTSTVVVMQTSMVCACRGRKGI